MDPIFPGPENSSKRIPTTDILSEIKFTLVFDEKIDSKQIPEILNEGTKETINELHEIENSKSEDSEDKEDI